MTAAARETGSEFAINGRFLVQPVTGVQRYAREVMRALDVLLSASGRRGTVVAPPGHAKVPNLGALQVRRAGFVRGHVWEQTVLPSRWRGPLLNLCNTAPVVRAEQIVCIHDANVFRTPDSYGRAFRALYSVLQPLLARRSSKITTVSRDAALQLAQHLPVAAKDIAILPNGHEHALRWQPDAATIFAAEPQARHFVLLLGSRARHKNAALVLGLAGALNDMDLDLLVAGGGADIFMAERRIEAPNVRWLGPVSDDDLALLFSRARCLAFPSFTEGFGLPIVEAMALGCPVVSSDRASMPEVCDGAALMAAPDDPDGWKRHFQAIASSSSLRGELRERGHIQARRFCWATTARGYLDLLDRKP